MDLSGSASITPLEFPPPLSERLASRVRFIENGRAKITRLFRGLTGKMSINVAAAGVVSKIDFNVIVIDFDFLQVKKKIIIKLFAQLFCSLSMYNTKDAEMQLFFDAICNVECHTI